MAESRCVGCGAVVQDFATCGGCLITSTPLDHIWVGGDYDGVLAAVIKKFKFERAGAAAEPLARAVAEELPILSHNTIVVPLPTATNRVRMRGYDQSYLLARALAKQLGLRFSTPLARWRDTRQLGASRQQRLAQAAEAFYMVKPEACKGAEFLLVDDVVTTGASLAAAARLLRGAGARVVNAAVVARQNDE